MNLSNRIRAVAMAAGFVLALAPGAFAQDIAASHLAAAREAVKAIKLTDPMDEILFQAASMLKLELIQKDPNLSEQIDQVVNKNAIDMASRRADLENEVALAYARLFSEQELREIAAFHNSPAGQKLMAQAPIVGREVNQAVEIWQRGIARDLAQGVAKELAAIAPIEPGSGPLELTTPAQQ